MRLGLYIFASLTFATIIGIFTYTINPNNYIVEILGMNFNFPVYIWIVSPMILLLVFTIIHMVFYGLKSYFKLKKWRKDAGTLENALYWSIVKEPKDQKYLIPEISSSAVLLKEANIDVLDNIEGLSPKLAKVLNIVRKINSGEYIDLNENKMSKVFKEGNPLLIKNRMNNLESNNKFVEEVMKSYSLYSDPVRERALEIFAEKETFFKVRKYISIFDNKNFFTMLNRVNDKEDMELTAEILNDFVTTLKFSRNEFIKIANTTKKFFRPDENLKLFKKYQKDNPKAQQAYLYLLFEYELMDEVASYLDENDERDFIKERALFELKKSNKHYRLEDLINIDTVCL